jgi:hypothetical protein
MASFHVFGLRDSLRSDRLGVMQDFVLRLVFVQTIDQPFWYFHDQSPRGKLSLS